MSLLKKLMGVTPPNETAAKDMQNTYKHEAPPIGKVLEKERHNKLAKRLRKGKPLFAGNGPV